MKQLFLLCILGMMSGCVADYDNRYGERDNRTGEREHGWQHDNDDNWRDRGQNSRDDRDYRR